MATFKEIMIDFLSGTGLSLARALAVLVIGLIFVSLIVSFVRGLAVKNRSLDNSATSFITSLTKVILYLLLGILVFGIAGVDPTSLLAAFSALALAVSLGLQNTLSSLANGILIIFTKPFRQGDYISIGGTEGTVKEIRLFSTKLTTYDNLDVVVPNSTVLSENVTNFSAMPLRRIDIYVPVPYALEVEEAKRILLGCLKDDDRIVAFPAPLCKLWEYGKSAVKYDLRCWVPNEAFWDVKLDLNERVFTELRKNGVEIPFEQLDVHLVEKGGRE